MKIDLYDGKAFIMFPIEEGSYASVVRDILRAYYVLSRRVITHVLDPHFLSYIP